MNDCIRALAEPANPSPEFDSGLLTIISQATADAARAPFDWPAMVDIEPELFDLLVSSRISFRCSDTWREYSRLKARLKELVGWFARNPALRSGRAYDLAHAHILGAWEA